MSGVGSELGLWLFRHRSALPFLLLPLAGLAMVTTPQPVPVPVPLAAAFSSLGLLLRALVIGVAPNQTSGRLTDRFQARLLTTTGAYSIVRHPLYVANYFVLSGPVAMIGSVWFAVAYTLLFVLFYGVIIRAEDAFLAIRFGDAHEAWASRTPAVLPRRVRWTRPPLPFCVRTVVRHDYSTWLLVVALFAARHIATVQLGRSPWEPGWGVAFILCVGVAIGVKTIKHRTRWLHVAGR